MTMNLKNAALQKLYDTLVNSTISMSPYADSPIDKAFAECDDQLSESIAFAHIKDLQNRNDVLEKSNATLLGANLGLASTKEHLEKDLDDAKKQLKYFTLSRDDWRARAKRAEKEVEELKETLEKTNADRTELQNDRDTYNSLYAESKKDYVKLFEENKKLKARTDCLRLEVEWYRKHYKEKSDKIQELKSRLNSMYGVESIKEPQYNVRKNCYDQGQTDLWVKLQDVKDMQPNEFDVECECLGDVLDMDLEDFLDAYEKWWKEKEEQKRLDYMRDYLHRFCLGKVCYGCPLNTPEFKCYGRGGFDSISDEDLKRYYEIVRGCGRFSWPDEKEEKTVEEVPCSFNWKIDDTEYTIETSIPRKDYDNLIVKIISRKEQ